MLEAEESSSRERSGKMAARAKEIRKFRSFDLLAGTEFLSSCSDGDNYLEFWAIEGHLLLVMWASPPQIVFLNAVSNLLETVLRQFLSEVFPSGAAPRDADLAGGSAGSREVLDSEAAEGHLGELRAEKFVYGESRQLAATAACGVFERLGSFLGSWALVLGRRSACDRRWALRKRSAGAPEDTASDEQSPHHASDDRTHQRLLDSLHAARGHQARKFRQKPL